jgi:glycosyltransferase involved in cell wall biosynthesis
MHNRKRVVVVMPAYNAEATLARTCQEIDRGVVDEVILVDDASRDQTVVLARRLGLRVLVHPKNRGYGGNQKTCYAEALRLGADVVIMLHPDYQYTPLLIPAMASMISLGVYDCVIGSRILGGKARSGGMPTYKYYCNRLLTLAQNLLLGSKLSEFHTGYRAFSREVLERLPLVENSDDFVFDNQMLAQVIAFGFKIGEISCPTRYFAEASSIDFRRSVVYGFGVLETAGRYWLDHRGLRHDRLFDARGRRLECTPSVELESVEEDARPAGDSREPCPR